MVKFTKQVVQKMLGDVPAETSFWCVDGRTFKNLPELESAFHDMTDETFRHHVNEEKNDFSNWIRDVIGDVKLADDVRKSTTRMEAARAVFSRIAWLKTRTGIK